MSMNKVLGENRNQNVGIVIRLSTPQWYPFSTVRLSSMFLYRTITEKTVVFRSLKVRFSALSS